MVSVSDFLVLVSVKVCYLVEVRALWMKRVFDLTHACFARRWYHVMFVCPAHTASDVMK